MQVKTLLVLLRPGRRGVVCGPGLRVLGDARMRRVALLPWRVLP